MREDLLLLMTTGIKKTDSVWKTGFVSEYLDTVQSQSPNGLHSLYACLLQSSRFQLTALPGQTTQR